MNNIPDVNELMQTRRLASGHMTNVPDSEVAREGVSLIVDALYEVALQLAGLNSLLASSNGPSHEPPSRK